MNYVPRHANYKHQEEAFLRSRDSLSHALLFDCALGKTKVLLDTAYYLYLSGKIDAVLVVAPKMMIHQWPQEVSKHRPEAIERSPEHLLCHPGLFTSKRGARCIQQVLSPIVPAAPLRVLCVNTEQFSLTSTSKNGHWLACQFAKQFGNRGLIAVDESSTVKNPKSARTKAIVRVAQFFRYRRILTGTPVTQSPLDLFAQFAVLDPSILGNSFYAFRARYAVLVQQYLNAGRSFQRVAGYQRLDELQSRIAPHCSRAEKFACLDLPPKIYQARYVDMAAEQRRVYQALETAAYAETTRGVVTTPMALTQLQRLRQVLCGFIPESAFEGEEDTDTDKAVAFAEDPRLEALLDTIEGLPAGQKVVIWVTYRANAASIIAALRNIYGENAVVSYIGGETDKAAKQARFNEDSAARFFVSTYSAGKYGLNLRAGYVLRYSLDFSLDAHLQAEDRTCGIGRGIEGQSTVYIDFVTRGTVDEKVRDALMAKKSIADLLTGDTVREFFAPKDVA